MKIFYLLLSAVLILAIIGGFVMLNNIIELYTLTNRIEGKIITSGWSAFPEVDLDILAKRHIITDEEKRDIYLIKNDAESKVREYIKKNLKLDDSYYPKDDSFIKLKAYPVIIDDITIYNPDELPTIAPNGVNINNTSIYISLQFPIYINFVGDCYKKIEVIVDTKTFYSQFQ